MTIEWWLTCNEIGFFLFFLYTLWLIMWRNLPFSAHDAVKRIAATDGLVAEFAGQQPDVSPLQDIDYFLDLVVEFTLCAQ
jgi:hypothetical protein